MLSRNDDSTKTIARSAKQPFQSSGSSFGSASGTWLFSKCRDRIAKPSSRQARLAMITHSWRRCVDSPARPGPSGKRAEDQLVADDDGESGERDVERVVVENGDAGQRQSKQDELDRHRRYGNIEMSMSTRRPVLVERAALVGLVTGGARRVDAEHSLEELGGLADAAGARVVLRVLQDRPKPDPATFLGSGKVDVLAQAAAEADADLVIFDNELSPAQLRELNKRLDRKVVDRTQLILDIFARRARTREGKLQVELAQLKYLLPRLVGSSEALSRLGGGIGTRGPGETKLEADRRRIRVRMKTLQDEIEVVRRRRIAAARAAAQGRRADGRAGRLYQRRQDHAVQPADQVRRRSVERAVRDARSAGAGASTLPDRRELLLSDTVGFIDRLPHTLVAAFRATLEETADADLVLHVIDAANPERERHMAAVTPRARRSRRDRSAARRGLQQDRSALRRTSAAASRMPIRRRC